ncbi:unnamed protein product [Darwinula stevensoni]|uniref:WAP domain-containing protein n=1 Tax=Darwinula stevensoni TaxID=69355 RepID=A0A7R8X8M2_9CRUS|nr:unnamed protein product [Darwinula stevensoni]CAG0884610.1 unnamed protein product [Darwinula stevensoni]
MPSYKPEWEDREAREPDESAWEAEVPGRSEAADLSRNFSRSSGSHRLRLLRMEQLLLLFALSLVLAASASHNETVAEEEGEPEMEKRENACPMPSRPVTSSHCQVPACTNDTDCLALGKVCCHNGCRRTCMTPLSPPAAFDWVEESPDARNMGSYVFLGEADTRRGVESWRWDDFEQTQVDAPLRGVAEGMQQDAPSQGASEWMQDAGCPPLPPDKYQTVQEFKHHRNIKSWCASRSVRTSASTISNLKSNEAKMDGNPSYMYGRMQTAFVLVG